MNIPITKYNPKFENQEYSQHENFVNQLPPEERYEFDELELEVTRKQMKLWIAEISYNRFLAERDHPDQDDIRDQPCREGVVHLLEQIEELKTKLETFDYDEYQRTKVSA